MEHDTYGYDQLKRRKAEAIADFETYLQLDPNASNRPTIENMINDLK